jgi:hypothetical protein
MGASMSPNTTLSALVLNCTPKPAPTASSTEVLAGEVVDALADHDVTSEVLRVIDQRVRFGVQTDDEGRMLTYGKVAGVTVVGNEDGAHHAPYPPG